MKKLIILLCLIFIPALTASDTSTYVLAVSGQDAGGGCDDCSGNTILTWHAENSSDVTSGTPCGCGDSDTTGTPSDTPTYSATASDGEYSFVVDETDEHISFDATLGNTFTLCQKIRATWSVFIDSTNILAWNVTTDTVYAILYAYGYDTNTVDLRVRVSNTALATLYNVPVTDNVWCSVCLSVDTGQVDGSDELWFWLDGDGDGVEDAGESLYSTDETIDNNIATSGQIMVGAGQTDISGTADFLVDDFYADNQFHSSAFAW